MGAKQLAYSDEARQKLLAGVSKLARAVRSTLGPRGRNAVIDKGWGVPNVTKDGVTVAEDIELEDPYENMGAQLVKEAASKTSDVAGDGTTTATVLAEFVYREGLRGIATGVHYMPVNLHPLFAEHAGATPIAERVWTTMITLPLHADLTDVEVDYVIEGLRDFDRSAL